MSKHILLYTDDPGLGGVAQYNHSLLCGLSALGYRLTYVQSKNSNPLVNLRNELGIQHLWLEFDTTNDFERTLTNSADAQGLLLNAKPNLIIFSDSWPLANFAAKQVAIQLGMPYIVVIGWVGPHTGGVPTAYLNELSLHYAQAKAVIAVSNENLNLLHKIFGLPQDKGQIIHYGRPAQYFAPSNLLVRDRLRQEFDIPADAVVCFTSARLDPIKGYQYQLAAIEQLKQSQVWSLLYFVWAGAGQLEAQLREAVNQLGVTKQVKLLGQRSDIPDWLDASDIFVLTSELEGMPLAVMEAMAKGLPVIASAVSGIPEELGDTGKLLPDPNVNPQATIAELIKSIQAWSTNPELRHSVGQAGKNRAEALFKEERMVEETVEVIERALLLKTIDTLQLLSSQLAKYQKDLSIQQSEDRLVKSNNKAIKKKALVFFPHNPCPPRTGAHQRCLSMLSGLRKLGYDVTLFSSTLLTDNPWQVDSINELQNDSGISVEVYQGTQADQQFMAEVNLTREGSVNWELYTPPGLRESFRQFFKSLEPDIIVINYAFWAGLAIGDEFKSCVKVIEMHDLLSLNTKMQQVAWSYLKNPPFSPEKVDPRLLDENFFSNLRLEAEPKEYWLYDQYNFTIAISSREEQCIQARTFQTQVEYIPLASNVKLLNNTYADSPLLIIGPNIFNIQGYLYFATKVLPIVLSQEPEFVLQVIGDVCNLLVPTEGIRLLGFVPDLTPLYAESKFAICPLIAGTGQQVKIVEAMAHGVPVIALRNIAESSPIQHGINGFIAENAEEFADYTVQLLRNRELCRQMGQAARKTIAENFSEHALLEKLRFLEPEKLNNQNIRIEKILPNIIIDGIFFQLYQTGIARVWSSLLQEWADNGFAKHIVVLDRAGTAPAIAGARYRSVPAYDYSNTDADREMLQQICHEEDADLFISTYYTTPLSTLSVFLTHDMIPELMGADLNHPMWREKHYGIQHASAYIAVSENTARDLVKFFPDISLESVTVAQNGVDHKIFLPASLEKINQFRTKYGISKPYFILVGAGSGYKNSILFFKAFAQLCSRQGFDVICTGSGAFLESEFRNYTSGSAVHMLQLSDEELSIAYSGAVALVYPSKYEGFGLPVLEAIACGCPVITCPNASIPEVAGEAALYVNDEDVDGLANALCEVQKPNVRNSLIAAGLKQAKKFSWSKMAEKVSSALIDATLLPLNLKDINLIVFPDWSQSEEPLCFELEKMIRAIATHPDKNRITLLVTQGNMTEEEAALILSSVSMNLLMQEDLDVSEGPEISLVGKLSEIQWQALLPRIQARIVLEHENQEAIAKLPVEKLPQSNIESFQISMV